MFNRVLVANRGEIAVRVIRALHELDVEAVAVYSTADEGALHTRLADRAVCIGPPPATQSYLRIPSVIAAAATTGCEAVHPGYGFMSENAAFVEPIDVLHRESQRLVVWQFSKLKLVQGLNDRRPLPPWHVGA